MKTKVIRSWPSTSNRDRKYDLVQAEDGVVYCTCPAWRFSKERPRSCKHLRMWAERVGKGGRKFVGGEK